MLSIGLKKVSAASRLTGGHQEGTLMTAELGVTYRGGKRRLRILLFLTSAPKGIGSDSPAVPSVMLI